MKTLVLLVATVALLVSLLTLTRKKKDEQHHLQTRWTHDNSHLRDMTQDHIHPWMNNAWYRYIHDSTPRKDCYVCSYMPPTTQYATLYAKGMDIIQAKCAASYASLGYQFQGIVVNHEEPLQIGLRNGTCDEWFWVDLKVKHRSKAKSFPVFLENNGNLSHSLCYRQENGSTPMGNTTNCKAVQTHAPGGPVKSDNISNGTFWVQGMAWICGQQAYFILPGNWTGQCAPIFISDHTFKITMDATSTSTSTTRKRRSTPNLKQHDSVWGSDVPEEFKLWTDRQKVTHALFPWVGVGKHALRIETLNYRFGLFLNASCKIDDEQDQEIDALRIAVMQKRVALDMILAEKGGLWFLLIGAGLALAYRRIKTAEPAAQTPTKLPAEIGLTGRGAASQKGLTDGDMVNSLEAIAAAVNTQNNTSERILGYIREESAQINNYGRKLENITDQLAAVARSQNLLCEQKIDKTTELKVNNIMEKLTAIQREMERSVSEC
ncbi:unnamed protein product [Oreochromis niloticus]|nr:unnamed protein product [Mustela putorius furo]